MPLHLHICTKVIIVGVPYHVRLLIYLPGGVASVQRVSQWPGQGIHQGEVKIPTQIYYDSKGEVCVDAHPSGSFNVTGVMFFP